MDQPSHEFKPPDGFSYIGYIFGLIATAFGGWIKFREYRAKSKQEEIDDEAATIVARSGIEQSYLERSESLTDRYRREAEEAREEADKERESGLAWMQKATVLEASIPFLKQQLERLERENKALTKRVSELERLLAERGPRHAD